MTPQIHFYDLYPSPDPVCKIFTPDIDEESDIQAEATQMNMVTNSTQLEDAHMYTAPITPNRFLAIGSSPSHEGHEYADGFEEIRMSKGNDDEEFLPLVCRH